MSEISYNLETMAEQALSKVQQGKLQEAEAIYKKLIDAGCHSHIIYGNLAAIYGTTGRPDGLIKYLNKALELNPDYLEAHFNLGTAFKQQGKLSQAISCYLKTLEIDPAHVDALCNLGDVFRTSGSTRAAIKTYRRALKLQPQLANIHHNLALALKQQGDLTAAIDSYRKAIELQPNYPEAFNNLAVALKQKGDLVSATNLFEAAIRLKPDFSEAHNNLGNSLAEQDKLAAALICFETAAQLKPNFPEAHINLGNALQAQGKINAALQSYQQALIAKPDYAEAHFNLSLALLLSGDFRVGWQKYEWRLKINENRTKAHAKPRSHQWPAEALPESKNLLVITEQGLGDTLQFMRYVLALKRNGVNISFCAQHKLHSLIRASGIADSVLRPEEVTGINDREWVPLLSLPKYFHVSPDNPIVTEPYIATSGNLINKWRHILDADRRPVIGINWQGNPSTEQTALKGRSLFLESFAPIAKHINVSLLSLQKGNGSEQLETCSFKHRFVSCQDLINRTWDFLETAAIVANCDLVITNDTSVAHLAGGMGKTTWLLLKKVPDWRWGLEGDTSFWYPSMRLFRQTERGNWEEVMAQVVDALKELFPYTVVDQSMQESHALALIQQEKFEEAEAIYRDLIATGTTNALTYGNLAAICGMTGRSDEVIALLQKAIKLKPNYPEAYYNLGLARQSHSDFHSAIDCFNRALEFKSNYPEAHNNIGIALKELGRLDEAINAYRCAIELQSYYPQAYNNLGNALNAKGDRIDAIVAYKIALQLQPNYSEAHYNLADALQGQEDFHGAIDCYSEAIRLQPDYADAHWNLSLVLLLQGNYKSGWVEYEWRLRLRKASLLHVSLAQTQWDGFMPVPSKDLLLISEQGLGDTLQFMRYVPLLRRKGINVLLCSQPKLHSLIEASGIVNTPLTPQQAHQIKDHAWSPLLSIPKHLEVTPTNILISEPYITTTKEEAQKWREVLSKERRPIIAINWQGNPNSEKNRLRGRSLKLESFAPFAKHPEVSLLSIQKGFGSEQLETCSFKDRFVSCQDLVNQTWDFLETAAIITNCDLVITSDSAVAHLAGGMGKTTWLLLHKVPDWRWGLEGDSSFWYPSMRLFRQKERGNWAEVMERVEEALELWLVERS